MSFVVQQMMNFLHLDTKLVMRQLHLDETHILDARRPSDSEYVQTSVLLPAQCS